MFNKAGVFLVFLFVTGLVSITLALILEHDGAVIILVFGLVMSVFIAGEYKPRKDE
jgi:hypothetical protein